MSSPVTGAPVPVKTPKWYKPWLAEAKVIAGSLTTGALGLALGILNEVQDGDLPLPGPQPVQTIILALVPTAVVYLTAFKAKHTPRPDLAPRTAPSGPVYPEVPGSPRA